MAQIFKTISLEERLKASTYNQLPQKPQPVNQGEGSIKLPTLPTQSQSAQLKITIDTQEKNSAILKDIAKTAGVQLLPNVGPFETVGLSRFNIPRANTKFRTSINLADRLSQPEIGTTRHLPQFFLADFYTDYITITRFGIVNHTSNIIVLPAGQTPNQGGLNPITITFAPNHISNIQPLTPLGDFILRQGGLFGNGIYTSITPVTFTPEDFILQQGAFLSNGAYRSLTVLSFPTQDVILQQGAFFSNGLFQSFIDPADPTAVGFVLQGYGVTPTQALPIQSIYPLQGVIVSQNTLQSGIVPTTPIATIDQGGLDPTPITFEPDRSSPILRVLFYAAQRALAFFTPRIVHGSADLRNENFGRRIILGSTIDVYSLSNVLNIDPNLVIYVDNLKASDGGGLIALNYKYENVGQSVPVQVGNIGIYPNYQSTKFTRNDAGVLLNTTEDEESLKRLEAEVDAMYLTPKYDANRLPGAIGAEGVGTRGSLAQYRALAYDQIATRAGLSCADDNQADFRIELQRSGVTLTGADGNPVGPNGVDPDVKVAYDKLGGFEYTELRDGTNTNKPLGANSGIFATLGYQQITDRETAGGRNIIQDDFRTALPNTNQYPIIGGDGNPVGPLGIDEDNVLDYNKLGDGFYDASSRKYPEVRLGTNENSTTNAGRNSGKYNTNSYREILAINEDPTKRYAAVKTAVSKSISTTTGGVSTNEIVTLSIGGVSFRAFISSFSDGFTVSWSDIKYVGRQDTLKAFQGVTRGGSLAFKVAAFNATDLRNQYTKLNNLVNSVAVGKVSSQKYVSGPYTSLTVGKWFSGTPIVVNSLKFDVQVTEYSWDYNNKVPHIIDVSLDFAVLGNVTGGKLVGGDAHFAY